jgi:hypothetical protein
MAILVPRRDQTVAVLNEKLPSLIETVASDQTCRSEKLLSLTIKNANEIVHKCHPLMANVRQLRGSRNIEQSSGRSMFRISVHIYYQLINKFKFELHTRQ